MSHIKVSDVPIVGGPHVRLISIDRDKKRNCLNIDVMRELTIAILQNPDVIIALAGEGTLFCSGLDRADLLKVIQDYKSPAPMLERLLLLMRTVANHPSPTFSLVTGRTRAGGVGLACCVDIVVMNREATLYIPGKEPEEEVYLPLARLLIPILRRRRRVSAWGTREWLGEFKAGKANEWNLADVLSEHRDPEGMLSDGWAHKRQTMEPPGQFGLPPRLGPDCFAEIDLAYDLALDADYIDHLRKHLEKDNGGSSSDVSL